MFGSFGDVKLDIRVPGPGWSAKRPRKFQKLIRRRKGYSTQGNRSMVCNLLMQTLYKISGESTAGEVAERSYVVCERCQIGQSRRETAMQDAIAQQHNFVDGR